MEGLLFRHAPVVLSFLLGCSVTALFFSGSTAIAHRFLTRDVRRELFGGRFVEESRDEVRRAA